jgi:hypothetical protein
VKIQHHRIDTNVVVGLLVREFRCSGTDVSAKVLAMYADTRTSSMEPQWLAAGLSQHKIPGDILFNVTADGKIQITEGQDWKYENGKNVIEEVVDDAGNVIYLIRDVRNPEEEEETEPDGPTDPHQSETTTPEETTTSEEETTPEETTTSEEETTPEETTTSEEETTPEEMTVSEEETTTLPSPDDEESTPEVTTPAANTTTTAAETTVSETPTTTPSSERVILGIEDMSRTIGMALAGFGAIMLTALIWLYLRSKKA